MEIRVQLLWLVGYTAVMVTLAVNRYRFWGKVDDLDGKILRVVTLDDKVTIHNAFSRSEI